MLNALWESLSLALFPYASIKQQKAKDCGQKFCHYTSAFAAMSILENRNVWMRNSSIMNDFSEVQYGAERIENAWNNEEIGRRFKSTIESIQPGLVEEIATSYDNFSASRRRQTYILSISEHGDEGANDGLGYEGRYGRLSMWRAYGGDTNVALILNGGAFSSESNALNAFTTPILYADQNAFNFEFEKICENVEKSKGILTKVNREDLKTAIFNMLHFAAISTKHPGFSEEREWRVVYNPHLHPSDKIVGSIETIAGVPQMVYKIPLKDYPEEGFYGASVETLIDKIIIGPTEYPTVLFDAFVNKMSKIGITNPEEKLIVSDIPLRRN